MVICRLLVGSVLAEGNLQIVCRVRDVICRRKINTRVVAASLMTSVIVMVRICL